MDCPCYQAILTIAIHTAYRKTPIYFRILMISLQPTMFLYHVSLNDAIHRYTIVLLKMNMRLSCYYCLVTIFIFPCEHLVSIELVYMILW